MPRPTPRDSRKAPETKGTAPATQTTRQVRDQADGLADVTVHNGDVLVVRRTLASEADRERLVRALVDLFYNNITKENGP